MKHKTIRWIGVLFAIVCIASGGMLVAHAQESGSNATIEYDYDNQEVDYELNDSLLSNVEVTPYKLSNIEQTYSVDSSATTQGGRISWEDNGNYLFVIDSDGSGNVERMDTSTSYSEPVSGTTFTSDQFPGSGTMQSVRWGNDGARMLTLYESGSLWQSDIVDTYNPNDNGQLAGVSLSLPSDSVDFEFSTPRQAMVIGESGDAVEFETQQDYAPTSYENTVSYSTPVSGITGYTYANGSHWLVTPDTIYDMGADIETIENEYDNPNSLTDIEFSDDGTVLTAQSSNSEIQQYEVQPLSNTVDVWLEDSNDNEIEGTEQTVSSSIGSISYNASMYEEFSMYYETNDESMRAGESNQIDIYGSGEMTIREEQTDDIVTEPVNVTAYGEESGIYSLDTSDGTVDITGLPDQAYTFSTDAPGYTLRNKYVEQLGNTESLYLLANDTERVTSQFLLEDTTNTFTSDARLVIERSIEGNGNQWEEIYSDSFGVEGVSVTLQEGVRYRISIENDEIRRTVGPYRAGISEQVTINPDSGDINVDSEGSWSMGANYDSDHINVRYTDPEDMTDSVSVTIHERGNESNVLVSDDTYTNPEDLRTEYQVPSEYNESNWIVSLEVDRAGETTVISMQVGPTLDTVPSNLDPMWRNVISVIIILTFGLAFSALNRAVGAIVLALVGGSLWWIGWLVGATAGVLVTAYLFIAIGYGIYTKTLR